MANILEITEARPVVQISEQANALQVLAPNAIEITDQSPSILVTEYAPQAIFKSPGPQGAVGVNWQGAWDGTLAYVSSDAVHYGGSAYICIADVAANSGQTPSNDSTHWSLLVSNGATGINWLGSWSNSTTYAVLDAVEVSGSSWICTQSHTNQQPPSNYNDTSSYWDLIVSKSLLWRGAYDNATRYENDSLVEFNGSVWLKSQGSGPGTEPPSSPYETNAYWDSFAKTPALYRGDYNAAHTYYTNDWVKYNDNIYKLSVHESTGTAPPTDFDGVSASWSGVLPKGTPGMVWKGNWSSATAYEIDDVVFYLGSSHIAVQANTNAAPAYPGTAWGLVAEVGVQGAQGNQGVQGAQGNTGPPGGALGEGYTYSTSLSGGDSSNGACRFDATALNAATKCFLSYNDDGGNDLKQFVLSFQDSNSSVRAYLTTTKENNNSSFITHEISNVADDTSGNFLELTISKANSYSSTTPFSNSDGVFVGLTRTGDRGTAWQSAWSTGTSYEYADAVEHNGSSWIALQAHSGQEPGRTSGYWDLLSSGNVHAAGGTVGSGWLYNTTNGGDLSLPAAEYIRTQRTLGSENISTSTVVFVHKTDIESDDMSTPLQMISSSTSDIKGHLRLTSANDHSRFVIWPVRGVTFMGGTVCKYTCAAATSTLSSGQFDAGEELSVSFDRSGDAGLDWRGAWSNAIAYSVDDAVSHESRTWVAALSHTNQTPALVSLYWTLLVPGCRWLGSYSSVQTYFINDTVSYLGGSWISKSDNNLNHPPDEVSSSYWDQVASKGDTGAAGQNGANGSDGAPGVDGNLVVGSVIMWAGAAAPDSTWMLCQGQSLLRDGDYNDLYSAIGTTYGTESGSHFSIPDLQAKFPVMKGGVGNNYDWCDSLGEGSSPPAQDDLDITQDDYEAGERLIHKNWIPELDAQIASVNPIGFGGPTIIDYSGPSDPSPPSGLQDYSSSTGGVDFLKVGKTTPNKINILPPYLTMNFIIKVKSSS